MNASALNINYHLEKFYGLYEKSYKIHVEKFSNNSFSLVMVSLPSGQDHLNSFWFVVYYGCLVDERLSCPPPFAALYLLLYKINKSSIEFQINKNSGSQSKPWLLRKGDCGQAADLTWPQGPQHSQDERTGPCGPHGRGYCFQHLNNGVNSSRYWKWGFLDGIRLR